MTELSLHILDVAENSVAAGAKLIRIALSFIEESDMLYIEIADDGWGMSPQMLLKVTDPFTTSRTTRRVGLGLPLFKMAAETAGGSFSIESEENVGTTVFASFRVSHIDRQPLGDMPLSIITLIGNKAKSDILFTAQNGDKRYVFDTREVKAALGEEELDSADILSYLKSMISENLQLIFGGTAI